MEPQKKVKPVFTISFIQDQHRYALSCVGDMTKLPQRVYWLGKEGKTEDGSVVSKLLTSNTI